MTSIADYDAMIAEHEAQSAEVRHAETVVAPPILEEQTHIHEAVAELNVCVEPYEGPRLLAPPPEDFAENPLIVEQQSATRLAAMRAIR